MAVFRHGKDIGVFLGRWNLSPYLNAAQPKRSTDMADTTAFGLNDRTYIVGEADGSVNLKGMLSVDAGVQLDADNVMETLAGGPRLLTDAVTASNTSLTSATANFTPDDVGAPVTGTNIFVPTTILSVTNGTTVVLSHVTTGSGSGLSVTIGAHPVAAFPFAVAADAGFVYGNRCQVGLVNESDLEVDSSVSGVVAVNCSIKATGGIRHGRILSNGLESVSATANGTALLDAGNAATVDAHGSAIYLFVPVNTRNGTVDVKVQHSPDNSSWADLAAFTQLAASTVGAQRVAVAANTTINKYLRVVYTVAGSTGAATAFVVATRH